MTVLTSRRIPVGTKPSKPLPPLVPNRHPLIRTRLPDPATHCGTVDAFNGRVGMLPRTMEQAFGPSTRNAPVEVDTAAQRLDDKGHRLATFASIAIGITLVCAYIAERLA